MHWEVQLVGDQTDLRLLADSLAEGDLAVAATNGEYSLRAEEFEALASAGAVRDRAADLARSLSGASRLLIGSRRSISVGAVYRVREDGGRDITVFPESAVMHIRAVPPTIVITNDDGRVEVSRPADPVVDVLRLAREHPTIWRALRLRDSEGLSWTDLYRILDVIQEDTGGFAQFGWAPEAELTRFKHTANSVAAAGDEARHGRERTAPPLHPMRLAEARQLIDRVLREWLKLHLESD